MKNKKIIFPFLMVLFVVGLVACSSEQDDNSDSSNIENHSEMDHSSMNHSSSGEVPEGLQESEDPTYPVGSKVIINASHMEGMEGAEATVSGAYDTTAYVISYTPTNGGKEVTNHKWVIQEEIKDASSNPLEPGTEVTLNAEHMEGMDGAKATIESAEQTTVYMLDYTPTTGGEEVKNHKWVTEEELYPTE
ncbi:YdhK family protein [Terribacillus saccharophilus]|uniref:YdhK family protein n=1 Tax=Terribacillus saccharophilus TaxID=361277 RepID=UPI0037F7BBA3